MKNQSHNRSFVNDDTESLKVVMTPEDLAELLDISVHTIYSKTSRRNRDHLKIELPPFFKIGKFIRFHREDVLKWLGTREKIDPNKA